MIQPNIEFEVGLDDDDEDSQDTRLTHRGHGSSASSADDVALGSCKFCGEGLGIVGNQCC